MTLSSSIKQDVVRIQTTICIEIPCEKAFAMKFDCVFLLPVLLLALIATFGHCDVRDWEFDFYANLKCTVKGSAPKTEEENPEYCWAFVYYKNDTNYEINDKKDHKCCVIADTSDDIPEDSDLKEIVKIEDDGM